MLYVLNQHLHLYCEHFSNCHLVFDPNLFVICVHEQRAITYFKQIPKKLCFILQCIVLIIFSSKLDKLNSQLSQTSTECRQERRGLQKSKIIRIKFLNIWAMLQTSRYVKKSRNLEKKTILTEIPVYCCVIQRSVT